MTASLADSIPADGQLGLGFAGSLAIALAHPPAQAD